jgi:hypothetical protein
VEKFYQSEVLKIRFKENSKDRELLKKRANERTLGFKSHE